MGRRFGKITAVLDRMPPHHSKVLKKKFGPDGDVRFVHLPREPPYPSMIEEYRRHTKHRLLASEYYPEFADMRRAASEYPRTPDLKLDTYAYIDRRAAPTPKSLDLSYATKIILNTCVAELLAASVHE